MSHGDVIIDLFLQEPERILSGEDIARRLGLSRTSVWKNIKTLQKEGYKIEAFKGRGYKIKGLTEKPIEREVKRELNTKRIGRDVIYHDTVKSTNDIAKELARRGGKEGTVVVAAEQSKGRGRLNRTWRSPRGGVFMSILLKPDLHPGALSRLTLLSGLAVVRAIKSLYGLAVELKWPNDLIVKDRKLGGILSEMEGEAQRVNFVVIGIGLNANTKVSINTPTTSIKELIGGEVELVQLIREILTHFEQLYEGFLSGSLAFIEEYKDISHTLEKDVKIIQQGGVIIGRAVDIDEDGAMVLRLADGSYQKVLSGDCVTLR
jgi:BirA family biotin operon repressor/biotin-[acetyl-CoA-carboxylase] ligase